MAIRTVRLDDETEEVLRQVRKATGLPISEVLKRGVRAFQEKVQSQKPVSPYEIYKRIQLGVGGWAIDDSTQVRRGMSRALKKKFKK